MNDDMAEAVRRLVHESADCERKVDYWRRLAITAEVEVTRLNALLEETARLRAATENP